MSGTHWGILKSKGIENHPLIQQQPQIPRAQSWQASKRIYSSRAKRTMRLKVCSREKARTQGSAGGSRGLNAHN